MLDPAPRIALDPELGLCAAGRSAQEAAIGLEIYQHTLEVILRAEALGGYRALPQCDLFEVEYWDLEQVKLQRAGARPAFAGQVALVTGGASGIGRACVQTLRSRGAAVIVLDRDPAVRTALSGVDVLGLECDITDAVAVEQALETGVRRFGGLDMLVLNAGTFDGGARIADSDLGSLRALQAVHVEANFQLLKASHGLLQLAAGGGRVVVVGSRNVTAPGIGAAAYSVSKAALTQLARLAALEWAADGIRVNTIHPDAVFDTALWSEETLQARAQAYGLSVEAYKTRNLLRTAITSHDIAELVCAMLGPAFACTTGAQVPIDGGNERVI